MVNEKVKGIIRATTGLILGGIAVAIGLMAHTTYKDEGVNQIMNGYDKIAKSRDKSIRNRAEEEEKKRQNLFNIQKQDMINLDLQERQQLQADFKTKATTLTSNFTANATALTNEFNIKLNSAKTELLSKEAELNKLMSEVRAKFFSPLEALTQVSTNIPTLTEGEKEGIIGTYMGVNFYIDIIQPKQVIYKKKVNENLIVQANLLDSKTYSPVIAQKGMQYEAKVREDVTSHLYITRRDSNERLLSANFYHITNPASEEDKINKTSPDATILFMSGQKIMTIDNDTNGYLTEVEGSNRLYRSSDSKVLAPYNTHATNVLKDFRSLYLRGPNVQVTTNNSQIGGLSTNSVQNGK